MPLRLLQSTSQPSPLNSPTSPSDSSSLWRILNTPVGQLANRLMASMTIVAKHRPNTAERFVETLEAIAKEIEKDSA